MRSSPSPRDSVAGAGNARVAGVAASSSVLYGTEAGTRQNTAWLQDCAQIKRTEETMDIDRRQLILPALALGLLSVVPAFAASEDEDAVGKSVEAFRAAQFAANAEALASLCATELSYSHSDGRVEDKATFIANATNGKSKFLSLEYQDTKIRVVGPAAIVRFHWVGEQEAVADGKKSSTNLHILMNWQKQAADWKLLSRASTKL
ncbi:MAG TPA: nuclear transport factor 2 family protein [Bradyrhizobium sp.]|nr:nuclear transport factor 2 family protein [Bradyrhizobium sp.]